MDCEREVNNVSNWISNYVKRANKKGVVIGLSGGIDSALVASLSVRTLGKDNVLGIIMPCESPGISVWNAKKVADKLGIKAIKSDLTDMFNKWKELVYNDMTPNRIICGNQKARLRMSILYSFAHFHDYLVIGTTNKTEAMIGYYTKYGDGGVDFEPIADYWKMEVFEMARYLEVPKEVIDIPPSADLWEGQTDESELGMRYVEMDTILKAIEEASNFIDQHFEENSIFIEKLADRLGCDKKVALEKFNKMNNMVVSSWHKKNMPPSYER